jgi:hypothetical protein
MDTIIAKYSKNAFEEEEEYNAATASKPTTDLTFSLPPISQVPLTAVYDLLNPLST